MTNAMSATHPERFVYEVRIKISRSTFKPEGAEWIVFDRFHHSAAHLHGRLSEERSEWSSAIRPLRAGRFTGLWFEPYGIELHRPKSPHKGAVAIKHCGVLAGKCYPDGTSLGASRFAEWWTGDDARAFGEVRSWLTRDEGEAQ